MLELALPPAHGPAKSDAAPVAPPDARYHQTDAKLRAARARLEAAPENAPEIEVVPAEDDPTDYRFFSKADPIDDSRE